MTLENDRMIRALLRQPVDRRPVWLMRQAGRYLPEYLALRQRVPNFMTFCKTPDLVCTATLQPLSRFPLDAAILFSDILTIPDAMGMSLRFDPEKGPLINDPIRQECDLQRLKPVKVLKDLAYVIDAIRLVTKELDGQVPLIGFAGSPWTMAVYMVEGQSSKMFTQIRTMTYQSPQLLHTLLTRLAVVTVEYLNAQIVAGAKIVMLFDTWGGLLSYGEYLEFSLHYMRFIMQRLHRSFNGQPVPVILFTKNAAPWLSQIAASGCDAVGIDASLNMLTVKQQIGSQVALQGNLDPFLLFAKPEIIQQRVGELLDCFGSAPGLVVNLGHGVDRHTPVEGVAAMVEAVHQHRCSL